MPARFAFSCLTLIGDDRFERIALLVQRQLYAIGIDMRLVPVTSAELATVLEHGRLRRVHHGGCQRPNSELGLSALAFAGRRPDGTVSDRLCRPPTGRSIDCQIARTDEEIREALADVMRAMRNDPPAAFLT